MNTSDLKLAIGRRIHKFRTEKGYTQAQFAESIDISVNFLSEIENGKKGMSQDTICKLCSHFNISADSILFGKTEEISDAQGTLLKIANTLDSNDLDLVIEYLSALKKMKTKNL